MGKKTRLVSGLAAVSLTAVTFSGAAMATPDNQNNIGDGSSGTAGALRIAGATRYDTSIEAAKSLYRAQAAQSNGTVYLTGGTAYADSLAVAPLADCTNAPVLLTPQSGVNQNVMNYLKTINPSKIVIVGDGDSVSSNLEASLVSAGITQRENVERIAGKTRFETAYKLAAETLACDDVKGTTGDALTSAKAKLQADQFAEADYQSALSAWNTARANKAAADKAYDDAVDKRDALVKQLSDLAATLKPVGDVEQQQATVKQLTNQYAADQAKVDAASSALNVFVNLLGAQPGQGSTTLDINSTLDDYIARFPDKAKAIQAAAKEVGLASTASSLNTAIDVAKGHLAQVQQGMSDTAQKLAQAQADIMAAAEALLANQPILAKMGTLQTQINAANVAVNAANDQVTAADAALQTATNALTAATAKRPAPNAISKDQDAVAKAYDAVVADPRSGHHPIFLANGLSYNNALAAGPAAAKQNGVELLSYGSTLDSWSQKYIKLSKAQVVAVGSQASTAIGTNATKKFNNVDDYQVAEDIAKAYFPAEKTPVAVASGEQAADSVIGASYISQFDGGLVLAKRSGLPKPSYNYLAFDLDSGYKSQVRVFGDQEWITDTVMNDIARASTM